MRLSLQKHAAGAVIATVLLMIHMSMSFPVYGATSEWKPFFSDDFDREVIGANWRWDFGDGRQYLRDHAIHLSHRSIVRCVVPLPQGDMKVECDLMLPSESFSGEHRHAVTLGLRSGEVGSGGNPEEFLATFVPSPKTDGPATDANGNILIDLDQTHHVVLQIADDVASVEVDGKKIIEKPINKATSETNRYFQFQTIGLNGAPGKEATLDNFMVWAKGENPDKLPLQIYTPEENLRATVDAVAFIDPENPAPGIQKAIDSLPPAGGIVLLPEGELLMRRHLRLRSNVTLSGQGVGKTILQAVPCEQAAILDIQATQKEEECLVTVSPDDILKFQVGDGVCFGEMWGHPGYPDHINKDCIITAISDHHITIRGYAPGLPHLQSATGLPVLEEQPTPKELRLWFPQIYAHCAEFVELKDLTIVGGEGGWGGFMSAAVTFGQTAAPRITRVEIKKWNGDGISIQGAGDAMITDNTVSGVYQGYHPGTITQRFLWSRNLGRDNRAAGLFFCWFNRNGVYYRNVLDRFTGYAWPHDKFNVVASNRCIKPEGFQLEQGETGGGLIFNNDFAQIQIGHTHEGGVTHDFLVAANRAKSLTFLPHRKIERNMFVGNVGEEGQPLQAVDIPDGNFFSAQGISLDSKDFPVGTMRTEPVAPPVLPHPIVDGRKFYHPKAPDVGFQKALDQIAKTGGTLLLPGGRYGLDHPLKVPSGVTLAGRGLATILYATPANQAESIIVAHEGSHIAIRDLVILGTYGHEATHAPAIALQNVQGGQVLAIDVRGWEGPGIQAQGGDVTIRDCRALGCAASGFVCEQGRMICETNIARECADGFVFTQTTPGSHATANIAGGQRGKGFIVTHASKIILAANNASFNESDGIYVIDTEGALLVSNMIAGNHVSAEGSAAGIRLAGNSRNNQVSYNNCQDDQMQATQLQAILEDATAESNRIQFNLAGPNTTFVLEGKGTRSDDNFTPQ